jgi:hypothetical protein
MAHGDSPGACQHRMVHLGGLFEQATGDWDRGHDGKARELYGRVVRGVAVAVPVARPSPSEGLGRQARALRRHQRLDTGRLAVSLITGSGDGEAGVT